MTNQRVKLLGRFGVVALLGLWGACGGQGGDDALVGQWTRLRADTTEVRDQYTFGADGSFAFDENKPDSPALEDHVKGTFTASDGMVVATGTNGSDPARARLTFTHYANATEFSSSALLPVGTHDGVVGLWTGLRRIEQLDRPGDAPQGSAEEVRFAAAGTYRWTSIPSDGSVAAVRDGTWEVQDGGLIRISHAPNPLEPTTTTTTTLKLADGAAIVNPSHVWDRSGAR